MKRKRRKREKVRIFTDQSHQVKIDIKSVWLMLFFSFFSRVYSFENDIIFRYETIEEKKRPNLVDYSSNLARSNICTKFSSKKKLALRRLSLDVNRWQIITFFLGFLSFIYWAVSRSFLFFIDIETRFAANQSKSSEMFYLEDKIFSSTLDFCFGFNSFDKAESFSTLWMTCHQFISICSNTSEEEEEE